MDTATLEAESGPESFTFLSVIHVHGAPTGRSYPLTTSVGQNQTMLYWDSGSTNMSSKLGQADGTALVFRSVGPISSERQTYGMTWDLGTKRQYVLPAKAAYTLNPQQGTPLWRAGYKAFRVGDNTGEFEFIAAAAFDRALTDAEVAQVSKELTGHALATHDIMYARELVEV